MPVCFWRRVVADYTGGRYNEVVLDDGRWNGPVRWFDNTPKGYQ